MTREEVIGYLKGADVTVGREPKTKTAEALEMAIKALEQEPCEDAISRSEVLDLIDSKDPNYEVRHFKEDVECLPSVSTEKTGRWIDEGFYADGHSEDKKILFDILRAIQEHCKKKTNCDGCILSEEKPEYSTCRLHHAPQFWRLKE